MKLIQAVIYGFGKFYQNTFSFQDGIHVIYGPNEAGKSTLHTFLGCMLFGLERGRGRAARGDLYSRYLPWDHDATYGGMLTLETEEEVYQIQRSFRADRRTCLLSSHRQNPVPYSDPMLAECCLEGLTESLYYNTISVRSIGSAPDTSLAQELARQLTDLHQTGSDTIHYPSAMSWLRNQRKQQESLLTPDLEQQLLTKRQTLAQLNHRLQNTSFQERKATLQMDMDDCLEQLTALTVDPLAPVDPHYTDKRTGSHPPRSGRTSLSPWSFFLAVCLCISAAVLWYNHYETPAIIASITAFVTLLLSLLRRPASSLIGAPDEEWQDEDEDEDKDDTEDDNDPRAQRLRMRMQTLQQEYEIVCRQEWDYDHLLEQAQALEEELEQLTQRQTQEEEIRLEIQAIALATSTLQKLSSHMQDDLGPRLASEMSQIITGLTNGAYTKVFVDGQLHVSVQTGAANSTPGSFFSGDDSSMTSRVIPLESLSRGTIEQIYLAMRLAVIELLFPQGGMPLILDDCFLTYDDDRLTATLSWLAEHYSGQVLIFTCQKREAALLEKEQIPFTHIVL